jgi:hypothetical protein
LEALSGIAARQKAIKDGKTVNHARPLLEDR